MRIVANEYKTVVILRVSKITCGFSKINCGMESWANGNFPKSVVGRNRWILNKKMVKKSGNRVTFGCLIWYKTYFLYYLNFGPFTACFLYGPLVLSVRKQTSFHGLGTAKMAAFFRCEKVSGQKGDSCYSGRKLARRHFSADTCQTRGNSHV